MNMLMKKNLFLIVLFWGSAVFAFSQTRPVLAILPFTGGTGADGSTIASLFSHQPELLAAFTVVPRTLALEAIFAEHYIQLSGLTDSDTIASIGRMLNADYVLSGSIRQLGRRNLLIATIVNVESLEQVAGYWRTYRTIGDARHFLSSMAKSMVGAALERDTSRLQSLAIVPFARHAGVNIHDAETLAQILAIEILGTGNYVVLPRISTIQAALAEQDFQTLGYTDDEGMAALGRAINADLVLSGEITGIGDANTFIAQILRLDGSVLVGTSRDYRVISDGIDLMGEIAILLTVPRGPTQDHLIGELRRQRRSSELFGDPARFWSVGVSAGTSFAEPWAVGTVQATFAPFRHSFIRVGCDIGFVSGIEGVSYFSICPFVHYAFFVPFARGGWYIGAGGGLMIEEYRFEIQGSVIRRGRAVPVADFTTGFKIGNVFTISYTLRTDSSLFIHKASAGFTHRFQTRSR